MQARLGGVQRLPKAGPPQPLAHRVCEAIGSAGAETGAAEGATHAGAAFSPRSAGCCSAGAARRRRRSALSDPAWLFRQCAAHALSSPLLAAAPCWSSQPRLLCAGCNCPASSDAGGPESSAQQPPAHCSSAAQGPAWPPALPPPAPPPLHTAGLPSSSAGGSSARRSRGRRRCSTARGSSAPSCSKSPAPPGPGAAAAPSVCRAWRSPPDQRQSESTSTPCWSRTVLPSGCTPTRRGLVSREAAGHPRQVFCPPAPALRSTCGLTPPPPPTPRRVAAAAVCVAVPPLPPQLATSAGWRAASGARRWSPLQSRWCMPSCGGRLRSWPCGGASCFGSCCSGRRAAAAAAAAPVRHRAHPLFLPTPCPTGTTKPIEMPGASGTAQRTPAPWWPALKTCPRRRRWGCRQRGRRAGAGGAGGAGTGRSHAPTALPEPATPSSPAVHCHGGGSPRWGQPLRPGLP